MSYEELSDESTFDMFMDHCRKEWAIENLLALIEFSHFEKWILNGCGEEQSTVSTFQGKAFCSLFFVLFFHVRIA